MDSEFSIFRQLSGAQIWHLGEDFFVIKHVTFSEHSMGGFPLHLHINFFSTSGSLRGRINGKPTEVRANTRVVLTPNDTIQIDEMTSDYACTIIGMSDTFLKDLNISHPYALQQKIEALGIQTLTNRQMVMLNDYLNLCIAMINQSENDMRRTALILLTRAFHLGHGWYNGQHHHSPQREYSKRDELILMDFKQLVEDNFRKEHKLNFYASKLSISAKYLSTSVLHASNMTAGRWLDARILKEAESLLQTTTIPIKDIALRLGFDDPSDFGKFFKRQKAISPLEYRKKS